MAGVGRTPGSEVRPDWSGDCAQAVEGTLRRAFLAIAERGGAQARDDVLGVEQGGVAAADAAAGIDEHAERLGKMLKRVLAFPGQTVCRNRLTITVDGIGVAEARDSDRRGRPLPIWQGCRVVARDDVFLINWQSSDSLDGRYFGPLPASAVIGRAVPVWTNEE